MDDSISIESLLHISDFNNRWNKEALRQTREERKEGFILRRNELLQQYETNLSMIEYGNIFQKVSYFFKAITSTIKLDRESRLGLYVAFN